MSTDLVPLKHLAILNPETLSENTDPAYTFRYIDIGTTGRGYLREKPGLTSFQAAPSRARRVLRPEDTILSTVRTYLRAGWTVGDQGDQFVASTGFVCLRPRSRVDGRYLGWVAQSDMVVEEIAARSVGVSYPAISPAEIGKIKVPVPPLEHQRAIADFLDRETARLDVLIAAQERMVGLLIERRRSAREELVNRASSDGGRVRLGSLLLERDERLGTKRQAELLSVSIHRGVVPFAEANPDRIPRADELYGYKVCRADDIVLNRMRAFQGGIGRAPFDGIVSPDYAVLRVTADVSSNFLSSLMQSPWFVGQMEQALRGIGGVAQGNVRTPRVNWADLKRIYVPIPSTSLQHALATALEAELSSIDEVQAKLKEQGEGGDVWH